MNSNLESARDTSVLSKSEAFRGVNSLDLGPGGGHVYRFTILGHQVYSHSHVRVAKLPIFVVKIKASLSFYSAVICMPILTSDFRAGATLGESAFARGVKPELNLENQMELSRRTVQFISFADGKSVMQILSTTDRLRSRPKSILRVSRSIL